MAAQGFYSNWPTFHHNSAVPPPPDHQLLSFHDNFNLSDTYFNHHSPSFNNVEFYNPINYPTLSSSYSPPLPGLTQSFTFNHEYYSNVPIVPDAYDGGEFFHVNQPDYYSYPPYPVVNDACSMEIMQPEGPELPPLPEIYDGGGSSGAMLTSYGGGVGFNDVHGEDRSVEMKRNGARVSAQSMAARIRRRKISEKTSELGKLFPGGHGMTTAEMFQAAFKYIKFLQAQVGVLQQMPSSPGLGSKLQALLTCPTVQEKLYTSGKCIVSQTLGETLAEDHQGKKN
ncbi:transcription factor LRL1-like [Bidens hawaiensis]|uniref:transcription factor LRL1-like n=1 Tax=Bidens hawaiensis TaxID=980011 RepID=UPI00404B7615